MAVVELLCIGEVEEVEVLVDGNGGGLQLLKCGMTFLHSNFLQGRHTHSMGDY